MPAAWYTAFKTLVVAGGLQLAVMYDPPRRRFGEPHYTYVSILGEHAGVELMAASESVLTFAANRPTLWLPRLVPILPRRRSFISSLDLASGEDE